MSGPTTMAMQAWGKGCPGAARTSTLGLSRRRNLLSRHNLTAFESRILLKAPLRGLVRIDIP